jgi:hypothetical protein
MRVWIGFLGTLIAESICTFLWKVQVQHLTKWYHRAIENLADEHSSQLLTVVLMIVIWCGLVGGQRFGGTWCPHLQGQSKCGKVWSIYGHSVRKMVTLHFFWGDNYGIQKYNSWTWIQNHDNL